MQNKNIETKINFLYHFEEILREKLNKYSKSISYQKTILFLISVSFISVSMLHIQSSTISIMGIKLEKVSYKEIILAMPYFLSYLYIFLTFTKHKHKIARFEHNAIIKELEEMSTITMDYLKKKHSYISNRGTIYNISDKDIFFNLTVGLMRFIIWLPFVIALIMSINIAWSSSTSISSEYIQMFYKSSLFISILFVIIVRISRTLAFRKYSIMNNKAS